MALAAISIAIIVYGVRLHNAESDQQADAIRDSMRKLGYAIIAPAVITCFASCFTRQEVSSVQTGHGWS
jgi:uncharacterized membrane protein YjjP (DUF1212 family)